MWACTLQTHGDWAVWDLKFSSYRCTGCGHRFNADGSPPKATRWMAPWKWLPELNGRKWAVQQKGIRIIRPRAA